ncbi:hypothetical protein E2562_009933 [Oryza meyeriana var. granulata]|uniref:Uncharacterized protein n=1 Tax=Oryza meyeriana var. granulata TaxID=110450 RepID=A0A6G1BTU9_9ORYZ|nr:hypothetical protein E2562_009933 [Oryza meyeriana var. granulata]
MVEKIQGKKGRKTALIKVGQQYIDTLLSKPPCHDLGPFDGIQTTSPSLSYATSECIVYIRAYFLSC